MTAKARSLTRPTVRWRRTPSSAFFRTVFLRAALLVLAFARASGSAAGATVVINEIHYRPAPPDGKALEFVELHNPTANDIPIGGWRFDEGIEFTFPEEAQIRAQGYVVIARDRAALLKNFDLSSGDLYGNYLDALDNGGEELVLVDVNGALIDAVRYDDRTPWAESADGGGASLERRCPASHSHLPENWGASVAELGMSPLAPNTNSLCPAPVRPPAIVTISEIHYHPPRDNDEEEEYVELHNPGEEAISLADWQFQDGIEFTFPDSEESTLEAGGYLAVCRDKAFIRTRYGIDNVIGDFVGTLSNRGERIALVNAAGELVDVVSYRDRGDWSHSADGVGRSLTRLSPSAPGDDPANWVNSASDVSSEFVTVSAEGTFGDLFTQRLILGIDGTGEFIVDDVVLELIDPPDGEPAFNFVENGDFENGGDTWSFLGNMRGSRVEEGIGVKGSRGLRLVAEDRCFGPCTVSQSVSTPFRTGDLLINDRYRLSLSVRYVSGCTDIYAELLGGVSVSFDTLEVSPGEPNPRSAGGLVPFLSHRRHFPREPASTDSISLSVHVRAPVGEAIERVTVTRTVGGNEVTLEAFDDGLHNDGFFGDGTYGVDIGSFPHNTQVFYRFAALTSTGVEGVSPRRGNSAGFTAQETWGVYVNDRDTSPILTTYQILIDGVDPVSPTNINRKLNCSALTPAAFVYEGDIYPKVGIRFRGNTMCFVDKRNLKLTFNRGRFFRGVRKLNLQGLWTDRALLREHLAWNLVRDLGLPYSETGYVRLQLNGEYHGLFMELEHPDSRFLRRNGLDPEGLLYKAKQPSRSPDGPPPRGISRQESVEEYERFWEEESREDGDFTDIAQFIDSLHNDSMEGSSVAFMMDNLNEEFTIGYQVSQIVLNNIDSFAKNHFLYRDSRDGRWGLLGWDVDLVLGKFFDPNVVDARDGRQVGTLNCCLMSPTVDLDPWFTTDIRGAGFPVLHFLVQFFFTADDGFYRRAYLVRLWDTLVEKWTSEEVVPVIDDLADVLRDEQQIDIDRWGRFPCSMEEAFVGCATEPDMATQVELMKEQLSLHREATMNFIQTLHRDVTSHDRMKITELMFNSFGAPDDLEFVEILNTSGRDLDISGWQLVDGIAFTFPGGTLVGQNEIVLVVRSVEDFSQAHPEVVESGVLVVGDYERRLNNDGEVIRLIDGGPGHPATIDFLKYGDGDPWPDVRDGFSIELSQVAPDRDNDRPENWVQSKNLGGTPGRLATTFVRGDSNDDSFVNLSDAVFVLRFLFRGDEPPSCTDAADVDDDGKIRLNDGVYLLNHLFRARTPPPAPYPRRGEDPTPDTLDC